MNLSLKKNFKIKNREGLKFSIVNFHIKHSIRCRMSHNGQTTAEFLPKITSCCYNFIRGHFAPSLLLEAKRTCVLINEKH